MRISKATLAIAVASASFAMQGLSDENENIVPPNFPSVRTFPRVVSKPTWHEVCLSYNEQSQLLLANSFRNGVCDAAEHELDSDFSRIVKVNCPEGTVRALVEKPIASCIQPVIL